MSMAHASIRMRLPDLAKYMWEEEHDKPDEE
jgi:hypothetical protein